MLEQGIVNAGAEFKSVIKEIEFRPAPNYKLNKDKNDSSQLYDGKYLRFPFWTNKLSVGWEGVSKTIIKIKLTKNKKNESRQNGYFYISTAKAAYAGVDVPFRVDVYTKNGDKKYHIGTENWKSNQFADKQKHNLKINVNQAFNEIILVIHVKGKYFFTDEIRWENNKTVVGDVRHELLYVNPLDDSVERLKHKYIKNINGIVKSTLVDFVGEGVQQVNCWSKNLEVINGRKDFQVNGYKGEFEYICLKISKDKFDTNVVKRLTTSNNDAVDVFKIEKVLTSNGNYVYDPLIEMREDSIVSVKDGYLYILLKLNMSKFLLAENKLLLTYEISKSRKSIPVLVNVFSEISKVKDMPLAINWAYTLDEVFKNDKLKAVQDLSNHYINIFVVHPHNVPILDITAKWNVSAEARLRNDLQLFKGRGFVLLYLAMNGWNKPNWLINNENLDEKSIKSKYILWLRKLVSVMNDEGYDYSDWYMYMHDEATAKDFEKLKKIIKWSLEADSNIQIYMNPTTYSSSKTFLSNLINMERYVDLWQPQLDLAMKEHDSFFNKIAGKWCTYTGPSLPAKESGPLFYKNIPITAWSLGASCFGFWSYNDSSNSSSWDDFDGRRPDYSVVYESSTGPVSSLRWEAFADGVENFLLIKHIEKTCGSLISCDIVRNFDFYKSDVHNYEYMRKKENSIINMRNSYFSQKNN